jgi:ABC-type transporter Mla maintaining outer membrane lipid asymmetry ATPase subunit MlaF
MIAGIRFQTGNTVFVVSSDVPGLLSVAERVGLLWEGRIIAEGEPAILARDERAEVKRFLDDARLPVGEGAWD